MYASVHGVTPHTLSIAITVNDSRDTNIEAAVIYRIYLYYEISFISVYVLSWFVTVPKLNLAQIVP